MEELLKLGGGLEVIKVSGFGKCIDKLDGRRSSYSSHSPNGLCTSLGKLIQKQHKCLRLVLCCRVVFAREMHF